MEDSFIKHIRKKDKIKLFKNVDQIVGEVCQCLRCYHGLMGY